MAVVSWQRRGYRSRFGSTRPRFGDSGGVGPRGGRNELQLDLRDGEDELDGERLIPVVGRSIRRQRA